jgi:cyclopropane fatty-acyl-phospholipid synthase-like methyltransferase
MKQSSIREDLYNIYRDAYVGGKDNEWLRLGALGKVENIAKLAGKYPHDSVLEIGAGNGEIVQRLSEIGFGRRISAAEISRAMFESGVRRDVREAAYLCDEIGVAKLRSSTHEGGTPP